MKVKIIVFGQLTDIIDNNEFTLNSNADTNNLKNELHKLYPALADKKYVIALDKQIVTSNTMLTEGSIIALLPPFSGG
ncbi:MAG: MoaD/ThiS family protein [Ginsengibacter sp.]